MNRLLEVWVWVVNHPLESVGIGILIWCIASGIAASIVAYVSWMDDLKQDHERAEVEKLQMLAVAHRLPRPMHERAPQGFDRRVS